MPDIVPVDVENTNPKGKNPLLIDKARIPEPPATRIESWYATVTSPKAFDGQNTSGNAETLI